MLDDGDGGKRVRQQRISTIITTAAELQEEMCGRVGCVTFLEFASRIGFDRKVSRLTYFYLTRLPTAKSEFQTRFETRSRYSHTPPETAVIVNRERINNLLRSI